MGTVEPRDLRVTDAEREYVGQLLQRAVGQGMLSLGEFTERMDSALAAKTRGELNVVLADLPGIRLRDEQPQPPQRPVGAAPDVIKGQMSGVVRKGPWHVPPLLHVATRFSGVTLDFTQAIVQSQVVEIRLDDYCSSVKLIVPAGATVDLNNVDLLGASANNKVRTGPPIGSLHLVVGGRLRFGSVTAKHPFGTGFKRLMNQS